MALFDHHAHLLGCEQQHAGLGQGSINWEALTSITEGTLSVYACHRVGLGCCGSRGGDYGRKELDSVLSQPMEIGYCEFTDFPISEDGFKVLDKVYKIGSFIATWWVSGLIGYRGIAIPALILCTRAATFVVSWPNCCGLWAYSARLAPLCQHVLSDACIYSEAGPRCGV